MYENVIICYMVDYGDMLGDYYYWWKIYVYEGLVKIFYIIKWFFVMIIQVIRGKWIEQLVELCDFLFIFIEFVGGMVLDDMDGKFLVVLVLGNKNGW